MICDVIALNKVRLACLPAPSVPGLCLLVLNFGIATMFVLTQLLSVNACGAAKSVRELRVSDAILADAVCSSKYANGTNVKLVADGMSPCSLTPHKRIWSHSRLWRCIRCAIATTCCCSRSATRTKTRLLRRSTSRYTWLFTVEAGCSAAFRAC